MAATAPAATENLNVRRTQRRRVGAYRNTARTSNLLGNRRTNSGNIMGSMA
jgi:hypothetical protein